MNGIISGGNAGYLNLGTIVCNGVVMSNFGVGTGGASRRINLAKLSGLGSGKAIVDYAKELANSGDCLRAMEVLVKNYGTFEPKVREDDGGEIEHIARCYVQSVLRTAKESAEAGENNKVEAFKRSLNERLKTIGNALTDEEIGEFKSLEKHALDQAEKIAWNSIKEFVETGEVRRVQFQIISYEDRFGKIDESSPLTIKSALIKEAKENALQRALGEISYFNNEGNVEAALKTLEKVKEEVGEKFPEGNLFSFVKNNIYKNGVIKALEKSKDFNAAGNIEEAIKLLNLAGKYAKYCDTRHDYAHLKCEVYQNGINQGLIEISSILEEGDIDKADRNLQKVLEYQRGIKDLGGFFSKDALKKIENVKIAIAKKRVVEDFSPLERNLEKLEELCGGKTPYKDAQHVTLLLDKVFERIQTMEEALKLLQDSSLVGSVQADEIRDKLKNVRDTACYYGIENELRLVSIYAANGDERTIEASEEAIRKYYKMLGIEVPDEIENFLDDARYLFAYPFVGGADEIKNFLDDARALCDKRIEERRNNQSGMIYE